MSFKHVTYVAGNPRFAHNPYAHIDGNKIFYYGYLPYWPLSDIDIRPLMKESRRCVKVGGVLDGTAAPVLCSLLFEAFGVRVIGAMKVSSGLYVVALDDFERDFPQLQQRSEHLWMGPQRAVLILAEYQRTLIEQRF